MTTEEQVQLEKLIESEIFNNLTIEASSSYDGWNGTKVKLTLLYKDVIVTTTELNIL